MPNMQTEIILISTNFRVVLHDNDERIFNFSLLDLAFCLEYLIVLSKILCLIVLNIAVLINSCLLMHIFDSLYNASWI